MIKKYKTIEQYFTFIENDTYFAYKNLSSLRA